MADLIDVGEVSTDGERTIRWTIPRYMNMPKEVDSMLRSPLFTFRGEESCWCYIYPNGSKYDNNGWMNIELDIPSLPEGSTVRCCLVNGEGTDILHTETDYDGLYYFQPKWLLRTEFEARSAELLHRGDLRIVYRVVLPGETGCSAEEEEENGHPNLSQNLKDLYIRGEDCDLSIKVKDRTFRAHRLMLKARIPAFSAMLTHDMVENNEGVVKIDDCDPDVFNEFLLFIYSGSVENLSPQNMCGLYVLSDKYGLLDLKRICVMFMQRSLSVEMICDVILLATSHGEAELLKIATNFFVENAEEILVTVKWQQFMTENPTEANELFLKTLKHSKSKEATK